MYKIKSVIYVTMLAVFPVFSQTARDNGPYLRQATISQAAGMIQVDANSPRPLEQTLDALQQKYGWVVDYEDPQYVSHLDFVEASGNGDHAQVPAGKNFSVKFPATAPEEEKTLRLVVDAYDRSQNPGQFELRRSDHGDFYAVGTAAHDEKGAVAKQRALFDLPVTLATEERTITETVDLICKAVGKQNQVAVGMGVYPRSLLDHSPVKVGGNNVQARELLQQSLQGADRRLYWRLLFDPSIKGYVLNIHSVQSK
jgi:hypothetical protein